MNYEHMIRTECDIILANLTMAQQSLEIAPLASLIDPNCRSIRINLRDARGIARTTYTKGRWPMALLFAARELGLSDCQTLIEPDCRPGAILPTESTTTDRLERAAARLENAAALLEAAANSPYPKGSSLGAADAALMQARGDAKSWHSCYDSAIKELDEARAKLAAVQPVLDAVARYCAAENAAELSLHWRPLRDYADRRRNEATQQGGAS